jgi:hypothetical protein
MIIMCQKLSEITLIILFFALLDCRLSIAQPATNNNFIRVRYDNIDKRLIDIQIFKDSVSLVRYYDNRDTINYSEVSLLDDSNYIIGYASFVNSILDEIDTLPKAQNGVPIKRRLIGEYDDCIAADCKFDRYGRLIETKSYIYSKGDTLLKDWNTYFYIENINYNILDTLIRQKE